MKISTYVPVLVFAAGVFASGQTPTAAAARPPAAKPTTTAGAAPTAKAADPVVLTVGGETMTKSQYEAFVASLPDQLRAQAVGPNKRKFAEQVIELKTLAYEARRRKLDQAPDVKEKIALQTDNVLASEVYKELNAGVKVDDTAVKAYYDQHQTEYQEAKASHILIRFKGSQVPLRPGQKDLTEEEALAKAKEIREKLVKGADFATTAKAESDDTGSGANGGSLGTFGHKQMIPVFEQAAFSLPIGQISEPVKSQFGYHIIKVEERKTKTLAEVKPQIEGQMKPDLTRKAVEELRKTVPSTIDDQYFGK